MDHLLATAAAARSHYIVTADTDLLKLGDAGGARILSGQEFAKRLMEGHLRSYPARPRVTAAESGSAAS